MVALGATDVWNYLTVLAWIVLLINAAVLITVIAGAIYQWVLMRYETEHTSPDLKLVDRED